MLTTELCAHLSADFNLQIPDKPACFTCTHAALDQWEDTEKGTILVGSFSKIIRTGFIYCVMPEYQCTTMSCIIRIHP